MMGRNRKKDAGFTLMEVLLVLAILVILGGMVGTHFLNARKKASIDAAKAQMHMFEEALNLFNLDIQAFPTSQQGLGALRVAPSDLGNSAKWAGPYSSKDIPSDPWGQQYQYESDGVGFRIWSFGPDRQDGTDDDVQVMSG